MRVIFFIITAFTCLIISSCSDTGTKPLNGEGLDTTSHNFAWQTLEFGVYPSYLKDVTIINENDIWAVGEIHTEDTDRWNEDSTQWLPAYNAMHWDGSDWEFKRIYFEYQGNQIYSDINSVYAFSANDIWFEAGIHWNGSEFKTNTIDINFPSHVNKMWGTSSENLYIIGDNGLIGHYNGHDWTSLESGTSIRLLDIFGSPDGSVIWVVGFDQADGSILLCDKGKGFDQVAEINSLNLPEIHNRISFAFRSAWTDNQDSVYIGAVGRVYNVPIDYSTDAIENIWFDYDNEPGIPNATRIIRANSRNDLFIAGFQNEIRHYNGNSWYNYVELLTASGNWYSMAVKENLVVVVGTTSNWSVAIAIGTRTTL